MESSRAAELVPARVCQVKLDLSLNLKSIRKQAGKDLDFRQEGEGEESLDGQTKMTGITRLVVDSKIL